MRRFLILVVVISLLGGCVKASVEKVEQVEILDVEPIVDYYFLGGLTEQMGEAFFLVAGDLNAAKEKARALITDKVEQEVEFGTDEPLNLVVFRGVFPTGGFGLEIERVEKVGNSFIVHATYTDPGRGMMVTQAFTQPSAIVPIGKLSKGSYVAKLRVTRILKSEEGDKILEEDNERASIEFKIS